MHTHTVNCGDPGEVENAVRTGNDFLYGDEVTYVCNDGYYQSSGPVGGVRTCLETGLWSDEQPQCTGTVRLQCYNYYFYSKSAFTVEKLAFYVVLILC